MPESLFNREAWKGGNLVNTLQFVALLFMALFLPMPLPDSWWAIKIGTIGGMILLIIEVGRFQKDKVRDKTGGVKFVYGHIEYDKRRGGVLFLPIKNNFRVDLNSKYIPNLPPPIPQDTIVVDGLTKDTLIKTTGKTPGFLKNQYVFQIMMAEPNYFDGKLYSIAYICAPYPDFNANFHWCKKFQNIDYFDVAVDCATAWMVCEDWVDECPIFQIIITDEIVIRMIEANENLKIETLSLDTSLASQNVVLKSQLNEKRLELSRLNIALSKHDAEIEAIENENLALQMEAENTRLDQFNFGKLIPSGETAKPSNNMIKYIGLGIAAIFTILFAISMFKGGL